MANIQTINNGYIIDYVHDILRKEKSGNSISIERFNRLLYTCMIEFMDDEYKKWEQSQEVTDTLSRILDTQSVSTNTSGLGDLVITSASGLKYFHTTNIWTTITPSLETRPSVDVMTRKQYLDRINSTLLFPTIYYPIGMIESILEPTDSVDGTVTYKIAPFIIDKVTVEYLYIPKQPFFDYYIDVNDNIVYLPEGSADHVWTTGEYDSDGVLKTTGDAAYATKSVELVFSEGDKEQISYRILTKLGVSLKEFQVVELANMQEQKENRV